MQDFWTIGASAGVTILALLLITAIVETVTYKGKTEDECNDFCECSYEYDMDEAFIREQNIWFAIIEIEELVAEMRADIAELMAEYLDDDLADE
jgi:hypothetical protein